MFGVFIIFIVFHTISTFQFSNVCANIIVQYRKNSDSRSIRHNILKRSAIDLLNANATKSVAHEKVSADFSRKLIRRGCPMSPYAIYLTNDQQEVLYELVTEARKTGADEAVVKEHINKYLAKILTPQKLAEFNEANERFEKERRDKRVAEEFNLKTSSIPLPYTNIHRNKQLPQKLTVKSNEDISEILRRRS